MILISVLLLSSSFCTAYGQTRSKSEAKGLCSFSEGNYSISWSYDDSTQMVLFDLSMRAPPSTANFWTGVGFGPNMKDMDFIGVLVRDGQVGLADTHTTAYGQPIPDEVSDVSITAFDWQKKEGIVRARFGRAMVTEDKQNDKPLDVCQMWNFPVKGGAIQGTGLGKHLETPKRIKVCDVAKNCRLSQSMAAAETFTETGSPIPTDSTTVAADIEGTNKSCSFETEGYRLEWSVDAVSDTVTFQLSTVVDKPLFWTGLAFGQQLADVDMIVVLVENGVVRGVHEYRSTDENQLRPERDNNGGQGQDVVYDSLAGSGSDNTLNVSFSRPLNTNSSNLTDCLTMFFPTEGGILQMKGNRALLQPYTAGPEQKRVCNIAHSCLSSHLQSMTEEDKKVTSDTVQSEGTPSTVKCNPNQSDLPICTGYFKEYFGRVDEWSKLHKVTPQSQYWKGCKLIGEIENVKDSCCNIYAKQCHDYLS